MGSGHLMRCLTLANGMRQGGDLVTFISRAHDGNMIDFLREQGHVVIALPGPPPGRLEGYAAWLGVSPSQDADETIAALSGPVDVLVVDHYGIDAIWEQALSAHAKAVMVIDDLAERRHDCDLLLDQNLVADLENRYHGLLPPRAHTLLGPAYGLVRPEFAGLRSASLARRQSFGLASLLIFMGGGDPDDDTSKALEGALLSGIRWEQIDVVVGLSYAGRDALAQRIAGNPEVALHVQTPHMARLMADADLAITTGGSISWEKCVLGLPSLVAVQADNQTAIAAALGEAGAQINLGRSSALMPGDYATGLRSLWPGKLRATSQAASAICHGDGVKRVLAAIYEILQS
ncbi:MAG: hypothetical protein JWR51_35 [Devosia sp.]|nr:hypothetical protein [Devosia sp.]